MHSKLLIFAAFSLIAAISILSGCGPGDKQPPIDLDAATGPTAADFSSETDLATRYDSSVLPFYESGQGGVFVGAAGIKINYRVFPVANEKGAIVFLPGRTEPILKHAENFQDLNKQGYTVYAMDHRGQGASGRMLSNPQIGYVEYFKDYVDDVDSFMNNIVLASPHEHLFLVAHSMGGAIAAMYLYEHPGHFQAAVLSSPMIGINTGAFPSSVAADISLSDCGFSSGASYAIGQADFDPNAQFTDASNDVTRSEPRFALKMKMFLDNPELELGGVSYRWLCESLTADSHLQALGGSNDIPTLMFQAGNDDIVDLGAENKYCGDAPRCQLKRYDSAYHEIFSERDLIRNDALMRTVRFLDYFVGGGQ